MHTMEQELLKILVSPLDGTAVNTFDPWGFPPFISPLPKPQTAPCLCPFLPPSFLPSLQSTADTSHKLRHKQIAHTLTAAP